MYGYNLKYDFHYTHTQVTTEIHEKEKNWFYVGVCNYKNHNNFLKKKKNHNNLTLKFLI